MRQNSIAEDPAAANEHAEVTGEKVIQRLRDLGNEVDIHTVIIGNPEGMCDGPCPAAATRMVGKPDVTFQKGDSAYLNGKIVRPSGQSPMQAAKVATEMMIEDEVHADEISPLEYMPTIIPGELNDE